jgi:hypothetical protein
MSSHRSIERVLDALGNVEKQHDGSFKALCPAHDDTHPSLSITEKEDGTALVHCFVCQEQEKVLRALEELGIARSDLFERNGRGPDRYGGKKAKRRMCVTRVYDNYRTPDGKLIKHLTLRGKLPPEGKEHHPDCQGEHFYSNRKDKDFRQARPDPGVGRSVRIHLPSLRRFMEERATEKISAATGGRHQA